jgi:hypothetical protein
MKSPVSISDRGYRALCYNERVRSDEPVRSERSDGTMKLERVTPVKGSHRMQEGECQINEKGR